MSCLCCCFRPPNEEEPNSLVKKNDSPAASPRKSYGAITIQEETPATKPASPPGKSPSELLYTKPPQSARVKSPETIKDGETSSSKTSPDKRTLAEIAETAQRVTSAFPAQKKTRTSTPSPTVDNHKHVTAEDYEERGVDVPLIPPGGETSAYGSNESMESDTCHSLGEEESEDARILRMMPSVSAAPSSTGSGGGSQTHLVPSSPGSSTQDLSTGKKKTKAKDFMKKAGKNMKKAKKKVGKGMEKMIHSKKKEEETKGHGDTKERADSSSPNETSSPSGQFKRVSSERMKSKYARDKLAALEKKKEEEASHKSSQGFPDPRQT
ncbi:uncharacterized protein LOC593646 isoform X2 [Strongylocentrotus purpuratus]|uniref:Uncharacterized protein n=1 Tax=Strongylocentrotus purpuratus TaxID=7668 RepID=A0A7M7HHI2_STRPU|nr:uncharacterized protein LOC593646 isoform X2 [Strongylocentrotus purpuratus]|eukprot:XP_011677153.1 PREDICTED: uncharacterized protein LOC593646 isoform X2 [Strongylocentrotus purpuratus]